MDEVDDLTFANRFGEAQRAVLSDIVNARVSQDSFVFDRNSLLKEVTTASFIGKILFSAVFRAAAKEIKEGPSRR